MKARIKKTGEIINIADYARVTLDKYNGSGIPIEMPFEDVEILQEKSDDIDWEKRRFELAKTFSLEFVKNALRTGDETLYSDVAQSSVELADALIAELKKGGLE